MILRSGNKAYDLAGAHSYAYDEKKKIFTIYYGPVVELKGDEAEKAWNEIFQHSANIKPEPKLL